MLTFVTDEALKGLFRKNAEQSRKYESLKASRDKDDSELATARKQFDENQQQLEVADQRYQNTLDQQLRGLTAKSATLEGQLDLARGLTAGAGPRASAVSLAARQEQR